MPLGGTYNNNKGNDFIHPRTSSYYRWYNSEGKIEKTALTPGFWKGLLRLGIAPRKEGAVGDGDTLYDYDKEIQLHLSHTKAAIMIGEIDKFITDYTANPTKPISYGVNTNKGLLAITNSVSIAMGLEPIPALVIYVIDNDNGQVSASTAYEFRTNYHYAIRDFDDKTMAFNKEFYDLIEVTEFKTLLEQYVYGATSAQAHYVYDRFKYDKSQLDNKLETLANGLGVTLGNKSKRGGYNNTSYFNNNSGGGSQSAAKANVEAVTYDDLIVG